VKAGANLDLKEDKGLTAAGCALEKGHDAWFKLIVTEHIMEKGRLNFVSSFVFFSSFLPFLEKKKKKKKKKKN